MSSAVKLLLPPAVPDWAYFLDVDGTLLELAATPGEVHVPLELKTTLALAHRCCNGALAIVSGRPLAELDHLLGLPQLSAAGQHGLEIRDAQGKINRQHVETVDMQNIVQYLHLLKERHPGLLIEDKGGTLAIHYRQATALAGHLSRLIKGMLAVQPGLRLQRGKYVYELKPAGFDKGTAITTLLSQPPFAGRKPVFIGDDLTDEHGFAAINKLGGISIKVGKGKTCAHYRIADVDAVHRWLECMTTAAEQG